MAFRPKTKKNVPGIVYLLHFSEPFQHAKHYLGWTVDLLPRVRDHWNGRGGRLPKIIRAAGLTFMIARTWDNRTKSFERELKGRGKAKICPVCKGILEYVPFDPDGSEKILEIPY